MEMENKPMEQPMQPQAAVAKAIGPEQLQKFMQILQNYKTGKSRTENRIVASENWWKLRNSMEEKKATNKQIEMIKQLYDAENIAKMLEYFNVASLDEMSLKDASDVIAKKRK